jgi:hypothetical protein
MNEQARNEQIFSGLRAFLLAFVIFGVTPSGATDGQNASLDTEVQDLKNSVLDLSSMENPLAITCIPSVRSHHCIAVVSSGCLSEI